MFIGSEYKLREDREAASETSLGYKRIVIKDRVLSRTETRRKKDALFVEVTSYHYTLMCLVDGYYSAEIIENQLQSEVTAGLYEFSVFGA